METLPNKSETQSYIGNQGSLSRFPGAAAEILYCPPCSSQICHLLFAPYTVFFAFTDHNSQYNYGFSGLQILAGQDPNRNFTGVSEEGYQNFQVRISVSVAARKAQI